MILDGGRVEVVPSPFIVGGAPERGGFPRRTTAFFIQVRRGTCATARGLVNDLLASSDETHRARRAGVRRALGFATSPRVAGSPTYRFSTFRGRTLVRYVSLRTRAATRPLDLPRRPVGRRQRRRGLRRVHGCVLVLKLASSPYPVGLTAGHCAESFNIGQPNPVQRAGAQLEVILAGSGENPDAAIFSLRSEWAVAQQIERGNRSPLTVTGSVPTRDQDPGERVCHRWADERRRHLRQDRAQTTRLRTTPPAAPTSKPVRATTAGRCTPRLGGCGRERWASR